MLRLGWQAGHDEILLPDQRCVLECARPLVAIGQQSGVDVRRRRMQAFVIERSAHLLWGSAEIAEGPEQLDVRVADRTHGRERALRILAHRFTNGIQLETDSLESIDSEEATREYSDRRCRAKCLDEGPT